MEDPDVIELRVLGCLIEKQRTTPDGYPLTLNALRLAANQSTNRDPVTDYDEESVRAAAQRLGRRGWVRFASGSGSRTAKYRQIFNEAMGLDGAEVALLGVLMLRGQQTPGELNQRAARLHAFDGLGEVTATLERLAGRGLVERQSRRPGQKEDRYRHLLAADGPDPALVTSAPAPGAFPQDPPHTAGGGWVPLTSVPTPSGASLPEVPLESTAPEPEQPHPGDLTERVAALEAEVAELRGQLSELRASLGE